MHSITRRDLLTLALLLLIAAVMRFGDPLIVEFFHDEAMLALRAQAFASGAGFPTTGILSSVGIPNPPTSVYVMALPYLFTDDPLIATLYVAALNVIGVGVLWWIAHRCLSPTLALLAGFAYALNPWAVLYSRKIWAQDFHTPFLLVAVALGLYGFVEGKWWAQALCLPVLLFALQIHFAAWALLPLYVVLLWMGRRRLSRPALALSVLLSALVVAPYAVGLVNTLQADPNRITAAAERSPVSDGIGLSAEALTSTLYLISGTGLETWVAPNERDDLLANVPPSSTLWLLLIAFAVGGLVAFWLRYRRLALLVSLWAVLPLAVFTPTWTAVYPHYFIGSLPAFALLTGAGVEALIVLLTGLLAVRQRRLPRAVLIGGFAALVLSQGLWFRGMLRYVDTYETTLGTGTSGFTAPLRALLPIRDALRPYADVVIVSSGMHPDFDVEPARWASMLYNSAQCVRALPADGYLVLPQERFVVLTAPTLPDLYPANGEETEFRTRPGGGRYRLTVLEEVEWRGTPLTDVEPVNFANRVTLTGYALADDRVVLRWQLPAAQPINYHYFAHLLDTNDNLVGQVDAPFTLGRHWCAGDQLVTWHSLPLAPDAATLRVGLYLLNGQQTTPVDVLDTLDNPAGNWVDILLD